MFAARLDKLRLQLEAAGVDCLALVPGANLRYLTGLDFHLLERAFIAFFPLDSEAEPVLVMPGLEVSKWEAGAPFPARIFAWDDAGGPAGAMRRAARALPRTRTLAVEHLRMRVMEHALLRQHFPEARFAPGEELLDPLRMRKDAAELASLRRACRIAEAALEEVLFNLSPGLTERQVARRLLAALLEGGGERLPFEPIVLSGPRSALPHGGPDQRPLEAGDLLLIDLGAVVDGYASDITRTFAVSREPDERVHALYEAVRAANEAARAAAGPGATPQEVDRAARRVIEEHGLGKYFIHRTGHGLGLEVHEAPSIVEGNDQPLEAGVTFTIEPGVYLPGVGGVRIEDDVVITGDGCESLTCFARDLRVVGA